MTTLTTAQTAAILGCSRVTVARMCQEEVLPAQKIGGQWAIEETAVAEYAKRYVNSKRPGRVPGEYTPQSWPIIPGNAVPDAPQHTPEEWQQVTRRAKLKTMIKSMEATIKEMEATR